MKSAGETTRNLGRLVIDASRRRWNGRIEDGAVVEAVPPAASFSAAQMRYAVRVITFDAACISARTGNGTFGAARGNGGRGVSTFVDAHLLDDRARDAEGQLAGSAFMWPTR